MSADLSSILTGMNPSIVSLDEQPILDSNGQTVGWNYYFMNRNGVAVAGGTSSLRETAKRIAVAEAFERAIFETLCRETESKTSLMLDRIPSTSGFAAGFEQATTAYRSACEAVERWAWSHWIDRHCLVPRISTPSLNPLSRHLKNRFEDLFFLQKELAVDGPSNFPRKILFSVAVGFKTGGAFAGSRVTTRGDDPWEHALIEASRNLDNMVASSPDVDAGNIIARRARYFGSHAEKAVEQIDSARKTDWSIPRFRLHKEVTTGVPGLFLFRSVCDDFTPWHLGDETRFVY